MVQLRMDLVNSVVGECKSAAMTSSDLTRSLIGHTMGELYPFWGEVTPMVLTAKSPA